MTHPQQHGATGGYEKKDADLKLILLCGLILLVVVVVSFVIVRATLSAMNREAAKPAAELSPLWEGQVLPPEPRLRVNGRQRLEDLRASEQALLTTYEWVDEAEGIARIPVSRAKELIASGHAAALTLPQSKVSELDVAIPESELPEYEAALDHARLISMSDKKVMELGAQTYNRICMDCHGDLEIEGSVPTSLRFGEGRFQRGSDPHTMYRTLTQGWRTMPAQTQLTPREKYAAIHYIREHFLKPHNPSQHFTVTPDYLATLPKGTDLGPEPKPVEADPLWSAMDYGNFLMGTFEISSPQKRTIPRPKDAKPDYIPPGANLAYKGIAFRLTPGPGGISRGSEWSLFEHDTLRVAGAWNGQGFIDWHGINFDGKHVVRPRTVGTPLFETADSPGWANPETGTFEDTRFEASDGLRYGPLPRQWMHYRGIYRHGANSVISYTVGSAEVLEFHEFKKQHGGFLRHLNIGRSPHPLSLRLANAGTKVTVSGGNGAVSITDSDGFVLASIPPDATPLNLVFAIGPDASSAPPAARNLHNWTRGGPPRWPTALNAPITRGTQSGAFQWDTFQIPDRNHWKCRIRLGGVDFTPDGNAVVCTWDGDVWSVTGIQRRLR